VFLALNVRRAAPLRTHQALDLALSNLDKILAQAGEKSGDRETVEGVLNVVCFLLQRLVASGIFWHACQLCSMANVT